MGVSVKSDAEFAMPAAVVFDLPDFAIEGGIDSGDDSHARG